MGALAVTVTGRTRVGSRAMQARVDAGVQAPVAAPGARPSLDIVGHAVVRSSVRRRGPRASFVLHTHPSRYASVAALRVVVSCEANGFASNCRAVVIKAGYGSGEPARYGLLGVGLADGADGALVPVPVLGFGFQRRFFLGTGAVCG